MEGYSIDIEPHLNLYESWLELGHVNSEIAPLRK
jgi:hypothetical protein